MKPKQKSKKSIGHFFTHESPKKKTWDFLRSQIVKLDIELPIVASKPITRNEIFSKLWAASAEKVARRFLSSNEYEEVHGLRWVVVEQKIGAVTEIMAYALSKKKPAGLASESKNNQPDRVLATLKASSKRLNTINTKKELKEFFPQFEVSFNAIKHLHSVLIANYKRLSDRESLLIANVVKSFSEMRTPYNKNSFSNDEIKVLIQEAMQFFSDEDFKIFNGPKTLTRLMRENIDLIEYFESGTIQRKKPKKKNTKKLRELENSGNRKQRVYPD